MTRTHWGPVYAAISLSEKFADLPDDTSRVLYLLLHPHVDDWGRIEANPRVVSARIWPMLQRTLEETAEALRNLNASGLIEVFQLDDGRQFAQVVGFEEKAGAIGKRDHRRASEFPHPDGSMKPLGPDWPGLSRTGQRRPSRAGPRTRAQPEHSPSTAQHEQDRAPPVAAVSPPPAKKAKATEFNPGAVLAEFPGLNTPEVRSAVDAYLEARRPKHGQWTNQGMRIGLRKLQSGTPAEAVAAFEASTEKPWHTVWRPDGDRRNGHASPRPGDFDEEAQIKANLAQLDRVTASRVEASP